jgi:hypothetical protein
MMAKANKPYMIVFLVIVSTAVGASAQTYFGLSVNYGNMIRTSPHTSSIKQFPSVSGNFVLDFRQDISQKYSIQSGAGIGLLGYNLRIETMDTLSSGDIFLFPEYSTFYGQFHLMLGRELMLNERPVTIGIGGGVTYYYSFFPTTTYSISNQYDEVFSAEMTVRSNDFAGYAKVSIQKRYKSILNFKFEYKYHFTPTLTGSYEFYHTKTPTTGSITMYQRELSLVVLLNVSR